MSETPHTEMLRAALVGYGNMGRALERLAPEENIRIARRYDSVNHIDNDDDPAFDVAIEFTTPGAVLGNIEALAALHRPMVIGTTGWNDRLDDVRRIITEHDGRLVYASNFSIGVNILLRIVEQAARLVDAHSMYDVSVHEIHHVGKADSPSGTALSLARLLLDEVERKKQLLIETSHGRIAPDQLHVTSQRLGGTIGTHTVTFDSAVDTIELIHRARSRDGFALGALTAARWIVAQPPGLYRFEDLF
jgi:4-hydroxy-tetrahydrodipicolinate reductase